MPIVMTEDFNSREWLTTDVQEFESFWTLTGSSDDVLIRTHVEQNTPVNVDLTIRTTIDVRAEWSDTVNDDGLWRATVTYGPIDLSTGLSTFSFDTSGGSQHVTQSIETIQKKGVGTAIAPDHRGAIGVSGNSVKGVDLVVPVYNFLETHFLADSAVDSAYKGTLFSLTGKVNNSSFKGFAAGEVLFLGVQGVKRATALWELNFRFGALPNRTGITVGEITGINKWGWEHLWVQYQEAIEGSGASLTTLTKPRAAYVEKVYETGNMADLLIGI